MRVGVSMIGMPALICLIISVGILARYQLISVRAFACVETFSLHASRTSSEKFSGCVTVARIKLRTCLPWFEQRKNSGRNGVWKKKKYQDLSICSMFLFLAKARGCGAFMMTRRSIGRILRMANRHAIAATQSCAKII